MEKFLISNEIDYNQSSLLKKFCHFQEQINQQYPDQNHLIYYILEFIIQKGLEDKYTFEELEELLMTLKQQMGKEQIYFYDQQNIIDQIKQKRDSEISKQNSDPLALFIRLKTFTKQIGRRTLQKQNQFDIISQLKDILAQFDQIRKNILIIGESGSGKTMLLIQLMRDLQESQTDYNIVYVNLGAVCYKVENQQLFKLHLCDYISQKLEIQNKISKKFLLILLDGYDEFKFKKLRISQLINKKFQKVKLICTVRSDQAKEIELINSFGSHDKIQICPFNKYQQSIYIKKLLEFSQQQQNFTHRFQFLNKVEDYIQIISQNTSLEISCTNPQILCLVVLIIPELNIYLLKNKNHKFTKYEIYDIFNDHYVDKKIRNLTESPKNKNRCIKIYKQLDFEQYLHQDINLFNQLCSWSMLQQQSLVLTKKQLQNPLNQMQISYSKLLQDILDLMIAASPSGTINITNFSYIHKKFQEFYIAQSIIQESINSSCQAIDENRTLLGTAFLRFDLDILNMLAEHVMEMPVELQYLLFFQTWYKSVLLTRKIKTEQINDKSIQFKLEKIGSNCINLLSSLPRCDLTNRDFSDCAFPYAYFYRRDLSGCNFSHTNMANCLISKASLDNSQFVGSNLKNINYGQFPAFTGHRDQISSAAFSPDSKYLASGSGDKTIKLWSIEEQKILATLRGHSEWVYSVAFSPDGKQLASGSGDTKIKLWNVQKQSILATLVGHRNSVSHVQFSPDNKYLASSSFDSTVKLWSASSMNEIVTLHGHTSQVWQAVFSPDGKYLASGSWDKTVRVWSVESHQQVSMLQSNRNNSSVQSIAFSPDGIYLGSGCLDNTVRLQDIWQQKEIATLKGHLDIVRCIAFSPDSRYLASASEDKTIKLWNFEFQNEMTTLQGQSSEVNAISFSSDGKHLVSGSNDGTLQLWCVQWQKTQVAMVQSHSNIVTSVAFSSDRMYLASGSYDNTVMVWSVESQKEVFMLQGHSEQVLSVALSPDGKYLASGGKEKTIKLWNFDSPKEVSTLKGHVDSVTSIVFSSDGRHLVSGSLDNTIKLWCIESQKEVNTFEISKEYFTLVAFSPDGKYLASSAQNTIKLWSVYSQKLVTVIEGHNQRITSIAFSPDSQHLASSSYDKTVKLWNIQQQKELATIREDCRHITSLAFSPDNKYLASGSQDSTVKLWSFELQKEVIRLQGHRNMITSIAISPDGRHIASGSRDNTVKLWSLESLNEVNTLQRQSSTSIAFSADRNFLLSGTDEKTYKLWSLKIFKEIKDQKELKSQIQGSKLIKIQFPVKQGKKELTFGRLGESFSCTNAVFQNCVFSTTQQARQAQKIFKLLKCQEFTLDLV